MFNYSIYIETNGVKKSQEEWFNNNLIINISKRWYKWSMWYVTCASYVLLRNLLKLNLLNFVVLVVSDSVSVC